MHGVYMGTPGSGADLGLNVEGRQVDTGEYYQSITTWIIASRQGPKSCMPLYFLTHLDV